MLKKLYYFMGLMGITALLSLLGLVGFLLAAGRLTEENTAAIGRLLRGEPMALVADVATTQPAGTKQRTLGGIAAAAAAAEESTEVGALVRQRELAEAQQYNDMLASRELDIARQRAALAEDRRQWAAEIKASRGSREADAFKEQIKLFESLPSKNLKAVLEEMDEAEAAKCLSAMKLRSRVGVIKRFKTATDRKKIQRLLALMRNSS